MHRLDEVGEAHGGIAGEPMEAAHVRKLNVGAFDQ